jgi:hypothetical protein
MTRRHLCRDCDTLVDVTGLRAVDIGGRGMFACRVATACRVRAARKLRTAPRDALVHDGSHGGPCRFCGATIAPPHSMVTPPDVYECRHVRACERRMVKGGKR